MTRALLFLLVFLVPAPAVAQPDIAPFAAREIAPGIHLLAAPADYVGPAFSNVSIIEQSDGFVLVDSGGTIAHGRAITAFIRSTSRKPVKAVLITHWHNDHPLGIAAIRAAWPRVRIIATERTRAGLLGPAMTSVGLRPDDHFDTQIWNEASQGMAQVQGFAANPAITPEQRRRYERYISSLRAFAIGFRGTYLVPPTETFADTLLIDDAERPVRLMFLGRANTDGDAVAWLPRQHILMTGDIVVSPIPFGFGSYPESWIAVLARLKALNPALLVPGHGEPMADTSYLDRLSATIADIRAQVGPLARQGMSVEEVRAHVDFSAQTAIFGTTPRLAGAFQSLWLAPMVENSWKEARGVPIVQGEGLLPGGPAPSTSDRARRPPRSAPRRR